MSPELQMFISGMATVWVGGLLVGYAIGYRVGAPKE